MHDMCMFCLTILVKDVNANTTSYKIDCTHIAMISLQILNCVTEPPVHGVHIFAYTNQYAAFIYETAMHFYQSCLVTIDIRKVIMKKGFILKVYNI